MSSLSNIYADSVKSPFSIPEQSPWLRTRRRRGVREAQHCAGFAERNTADPDRIRHMPGDYLPLCAVIASIRCKVPEPSPLRTRKGRRKGATRKQMPEPNVNLNPVSPVSVERRVFSEGRLSIGLTLPLLQAGDIVVDFEEQIALASLADELGYRALWVRDVPLNSADYPDPVGHLDPWVLLGALASHTRHIALVSGAIVLTLRHPLHIAKGAVSVSTLSRGRFILGLGSGDRPSEFAAFGQDSDQRREIYRAHWETVAAAVNVSSRIIPDRIQADAPAFFSCPGRRLPFRCWPSARADKASTGSRATPSAG